MKIIFAKANIVALTLITVVLTTIAGTTVYALDGERSGGLHGGGGTHVESAFKAYAIKLTSELFEISLNKKFKPFFKFETADLMGLAEIVKPECAVEKSDINLLKDKERNAYVKNSKIKAILIDCKGYEEGIPKLWAEIFSSDDVNSKILIVHELLRLLDIETEDSYIASGSLAAVYKERNRDDSKQLSKIFSGTSTKNCSITRDYFDKGAERKVAFTLNAGGAGNPGVPVGHFNFTLGNSNTENIILQIIDPNHPRDAETKKLYNALRLFECIE